jgi:hypothetical protein
MMKIWRLCLVVSGRVLGSRLFNATVQLNYILVISMNGYLVIALCVAFVGGTLVTLSPCRNPIRHFIWHLPELSAASITGVQVLYP